MTDIGIAFIDLGSLVIYEFETIIQELNRFTVLITIGKNPHTTLN